MADVAMKDYGSGFLALILAGILMMVIGIGLMMSVGRSPDNISLVERRTNAPSPVFALRLMSHGSLPAPVTR
jgi:hypothetical protein